MKKLFVMIISSVLILNGVSLALINKPVLAASAKKMVIVELFTQHWCGPCAAANRSLDELFEESNGKEFIYLKEHMTQGDELGLDYADKRGAKYGLRYWPSVYVNSKQANNTDGRIEAGNVKSEISKQKGMKTDISIELSGKIEGNIITLSANYTKIPSGGVLSLIISEDFTYYAGQNGEKIHRFLLRDGKDFNLSGDGTQTAQFIINEKWAKELMRGFAIVDTPKGIQNSTYTALGQPEAVSTKAVLSVIPNQVNMNMVKEGATADVEIKVSNGGDKTGKITFKSKDSFVKIETSAQEVASKTQIKLTATIQTAGLPPGTYKGSIEATGDGISKTIPVQFTILDKPQLQVSEASIDFGSVDQGQKATEEIEIKNKVKGPIEGTISSKAKWISFNKKSFSSESIKIMVTALTDKLETGEYTDEIQIKTDGGDKTIEVRIQVAAPKIESTPSVVEFGEVFIDKPPFEEKTFTIKNVGQAEANLSVKSIPNFCNIKLEKKFILKPGEEKKGTVSLIPTMLEKDKTYSGKILLDWGSMVTEIAVTATIKESPPVLEWVSDAIKDGKLDISMKKGEKKEVSISFKNTGNGKLDVQVSFGKELPWITVSTKTCALLKEQKKTITLILDATKISTGSYDSLLKITSNGGVAEVPIHVEITRDKIIIELQIGSKNANISGRMSLVDPPPYIRNGSTLVPLRFIGEAFGAVIDWQPKLGRGTINITLNDINILIEIGNKIAIANGQKKALTAPPEITGGRTFVPLRFIGEAFGADVKWNPSTQGITITY